MSFRERIGTDWNKKTLFMTQTVPIRWVKDFLGSERYRLRQKMSFRGPIGTDCVKKSLFERQLQPFPKEFFGTTAGARSYSTENSEEPLRRVF